MPSVVKKTQELVQMETGKTKQVKHPEPKVEVEVDTPAQTETVEVDDRTKVRQAHFDELLEKLEKAQEELSSLKTSVKKYQKMVEKDMTKANKGKRRVNRERSPSGFGKPSVIPESLRKLLKIDVGTEMTRPEVTKRLYEYLDNHNLRDAKDKRIMRTNPELVSAFGLTPEQVKNINECTDIKQGEKGLNFYNIQKFVAALYKGKTFNSKTTESESESEEEVKPVVSKGKGKKV